MSTASTTYALPVKTAFLRESQHDRRSMFSPVTSSPSGPLQADDLLSGTAHPALAHAESHPARRASTMNNVLATEAGRSWESKTIGPVPSMKDKRRARGQSDLGRKAIALIQTSFGSPKSPRTPLSAKPNTFFDEIFNGILLPLPFLAASLAFPSQHSPFAGPARSPNSRVLDTAEVLEDIHRHQHFVQAGALSAAALLLIGIIARLRLSDVGLDRRKDGSSAKNRASRSQSALSYIKNFVARMLSMALPFYAAVQLGGVRVAFVLLVTIATGLSNSGVNAKAGFVARLQARRSAIALLGVLVGADVVGLLGSYTVLDLSLGYAALFTSALAVPPPIPYLDRLLGRHMPIFSSSATPVPLVPTPPATPRLSGSPQKEAPISKLADANASIGAGIVLATLTAAASFLFSIRLELSPVHFGFSILALVTIAGLTFFALPVTIGARGKPGLAAGLILTTIFAFVQSHQIFGLTVMPFAFAIFCAAGYFVALEFTAPDFGHFKEPRSKHGKRDHSMLTEYLLSYCAPGSMLDTILSERDSRRIAYFACLNLAFMLVQLFYGFVTGSLGLLTDSIHMLFDCLGLAVGLAAAVMSKWPASLAFPYGHGKVDTLSGFANGIFLVLVSIEIIFDAVHRLHEGYELRRLNELLTVSILGFLVNVVGLTVFGHAHHGHGHGHNHSKSCSHTNARTHHQHEHKQGEDHRHNDHNHDHLRCNGYANPGELQPSPIPDLPPTPFSIPSLPPLTPNPPSPVKSLHAHSHENENMQGIFLHIMADALGSVAVIFSTLLTKYDGWSGWDPLASCGIALLIFFSAVPLVRSSGKKLLLSLPNEVEYSCRDTLQGLGELRGVIGYAGVRLWLEDIGDDNHKHHVHHQHHDDKPEHDHDHRAEPSKIKGVIHVIASHGVDLEDVAERANLYLRGRGLDLIVHVETEGSNCWCGGGTRTG
ncbi:uncharacterized protein PV09_03396 [Verruconis gallopava]|uniref:Zinc transporter n=1 Tax=Verruconis gallopava TaxID=253628 RepID=A0A0D2AEZ0_9PEZI|nr:uncharacterized protein PV09_03396 [Verruconis gallopava]KIW05513.1 hypothetical protein PV09_03396 [Verruconis gallopava]